MNNIKKYFLFSLILVCIIYALQYGFGILYKKRAIDKLSLLEKHQIDNNVIVFGSSVAFHHFSPAIINTQTGLDAYNMGLDALFFGQYNAMIQEYLTYEKKSKYIVLACDFDNLSLKTLIRKPEMYYAYIHNKFIYNCLSKIEPVEMMKAKYIPGYLLALYNKNFYNSILFKDNNTISTKGFYPLDQPFVVNEKKPFNAAYDSSVYYDLKATVNEICQKGIKVIIVMTPMYKEGYKLIMNAEDIKDKYRALTNQNVFFLDYTQDSLSTQKQLFYNYSHLNTIGANLFSNEFARDLKAIIAANK